MPVLARKDTDATLIDSPFTPTSPGPAHCFGGFFGKFLKVWKKRAPSNDEKSKPVGVSRPIDKPKPRPQSLNLQFKPRRNDTEVTIVGVDGESEVGMKSVEKTKGRRGALVEIEEDNQRYVSSPISETANSSPSAKSSILHNPSSLVSDLSSPTLTASPDTPSPQLPRALHFHCPSPPGKRDEGIEREKKETVRSVTILAAKTLVNVAEASNIPYLKGVAGLIALIIEYTDVSSICKILSTLSSLSVLLNTFLMGDPFPSEHS